jgi:hypothetical protein
MYIKKLYVTCVDLSFQCLVRCCCDCYKASGRPVAALSTDSPIAYIGSVTGASGALMSFDLTTTQRAKDHGCHDGQKVVISVPIYQPTPHRYYGVFAICAIAPS